jgi:dipeptidyl aminopeptidase/acylaminoacyl peptidase
MLRSQALLLLALVAVAAGCGGGHEASRPLPLGQCKPAGHGYTLCGYPVGVSRRGQSTIRLAGTTIAGPVEKAPRGPIGYWRSLALSPDGKTLLAQWSGECESPNAFFIPAHGGKPRPVTGERDWRDAPESVAYGWTRGGLARVLLPQGACGSGAHRPGVYLIDPRSGRMTFERGIKGPGA